MFCKCGTLIQFPLLESEPIKCQRCHVEINNPEIPSVTTIKYFHKKETIAQVKVKGAKIKMVCPICNADEMSYNTAQLRSADEGQTVFLSCDKCGYKDTVHS